MSDSVFYQDWLKMAQEDGLVAKHLLEEGMFFSAVCFHSQQMAEKFLKALLLFGGRTYPKTHDLVDLGELIEPLFPDIKEMASELKILSKLYIKAHYPADYPEFNYDQAKQAYEAASRVKNFVARQIGI